ncbi:MAG: hypothetical protein H7249_05830 [Chitinophagaceae bacterium]|nr:hypothetical protein [Oligoflexus sp.]
MKLTISKLLLLLIVSSSLICGCSTPSILISPDDQIFQESQLRLQETIAKVSSTHAPLAEQAQFIQAESLYRYRFEPPLRSMSSYFAEVAATLTEFPAFQALAASLDIGNLRLRSADSAVQLWEGLLMHHPKTELRLLTLYRLGWAYRNIGVTGFPRDSSDETFDVLLSEFPESPTAAFAKEAKSVPWKSKETAFSRSVVPGLGQLYVGETKSAIIRLGIATGATAAILVPAYIAYHRKNELSWNKDWKLLASAFTGFLVLSFDFTSSYEDSMRGVVDFNERQEALFNRLHPTAP